MYILMLLILNFHGGLEALTSDYQKLADKILKNYSPNLRPVLKSDSTTVVKLHFGIIQLLDVEEVSKTMKCITYIEMIWHDEFLKWDVEEFNNVSQFRYPHTLVWKPDIILTNTPDLNDGSVADSASTNVIVKSDGTILNAYTAVYRATCKTMDMINFPFDHHMCNLDFASWTYSGAEVDIIDDSASYNPAPSMRMIPNSEWDIAIIKSEKLIEEECTGNTNEFYPTIRITVSLKRKPLYFMINIIIPITITCFISFIGMFNPSTNTGERTEKTFLGITTLLAISLLMFSVSSQLPVTSNGIPLMGLFLGMYMIMIAFAIIASAVIMHVDVQGLRGRPLPKWVKTWFILRIGKWLHVCEQVDVQQLTENELAEPKQKPAKFREGSSIIDKSFISQLEQMLYKIETLINLIINEKKQNEFHKSSRNEWSLLSEVLDRMCLIFFFSFSTIFMIALFSTDKS